MAITVHLHFDGLSAKANRLDMRLLGRALIGTDRTVREALFVAVEGRRPNGRERLPLTIQASAPQTGSVDISAVIESIGGVLPFAHEMLINVGTDYIKTFLTFVLYRLGGRPREADPNIIKMLELIAEMHRTDLDDRRHERISIFENEDRWRQFAIELAERIRPVAQEIVAPVGPDCETLAITDDVSAPALIDAAMADAIRAKEPLEVGDMQLMTVKVDGITLHTRSLKIEHPEHPNRFISADVRDPAFDDPHGPYALALGEEIQVQVKPTRRPNGELVKLHIMDFVGRPGAR